MSKRYRLVFVFTIAVAFASVGAISVAQTSDTVYYGCLKTNGNIEEITPDVPPTCGGNTTLISWNETGPEGPVGPEGPEGPVGPEGPAGADGIDGESAGGMFAPVSDTVFGVTSDGCPADQWRLNVLSQSGATLTWDTSNCSAMQDDGFDPYPAPYLFMYATADSHEATEMDGASYFADAAVQGKITHVGDETWRLNCSLSVATSPRTVNGPEPDTQVTCGIGTVGIDPADFAEVLNTGGLESQSISFFK